jgi:hypothetical protein
LFTASFALSSCSGSNQNAVAASVNGDSLSNSELSAMVSSDLFADVLQSPVVDGLASGEAIRTVINGWLKLQLLEQSGVFKDVDRNGVASELEQSKGAIWGDAPAVLRDLLVLNEAARQLSASGSLDAPTTLKALTTAEVFIDPRYGRWDSVNSSVVPLSS